MSFVDLKFKRISDRFGLPNSAYSIHHPSSLCLYVSLCTEQEFLMHMLHIWLAYTHSSPDMNLKYRAYMTFARFGGHICIWHIFGNNSEVNVVAGCILGYIWKNVGSACPYSMSAMWAIFGMWKPYLFSDIFQICVEWCLLNGWCQWLLMWHIHTLYMQIKYLAYIPH